MKFVPLTKGKKPDSCVICLKKMAGVGNDVSIFFSGITPNSVKGFTGGHCV